MPDAKSIILLEGTEIPVSILRRQIVADPATGVGEDRSALVVTGWLRSLGIAFVLDDWHGRVLRDVFERRIIDAVRKWDVQVVRIETAGGFAAEHIYLGRALRAAGLSPSVLPLSPKNRSKVQRISAFQTWIANHLVRFHDGASPLLSELIGITIKDGVLLGKSPNLVDCLAYSAELWYEERGGPQGEEKDDIETVTKDEEERLPPYGLYVSRHPLR